MLIETLKELCALPGVSGCEDAVREYIMRRASKVSGDIVTDPMGNLIVNVKGKKTPEKKIMLAAHMDEVGVIVTGFTDGGFLKFDFVGGVDRRVVIGKKVDIQTDEGVLPGVIGLKPVHLLEGEEKRRVPPTGSMYIDLGFDSREEAEKKVSLGDRGSFDAGMTLFGDGFIKAKAIDDRIGCAVMLEIMEKKPAVDCCFVFTVQEEVGTRGAAAAAWTVKPDMAVVIEGTTAADLPSQKGTEKVCSPGKGPVIPFMDGGTIYDTGMFRQLTALADKLGIPWQTKTKISGGTDASALQKTAGGAAVAAVSAAVRYIHSPSSTGCIRDFENMEKLVSAYLETL